MKGTQAFEGPISIIIAKLNIQDFSSKVSKFRQDFLKTSDYYIIKKTIKNIIPS